MSFYIDPLDLSYEEALLVMVELKSYYHNVENDRDERDRCRCSFYEIATFFGNEIYADIKRILSDDVTLFNVMAPVGGPYAMHRGYKFELVKFSPITYQMNFYNEFKSSGVWAGMIYLLENPCGIDNFKKLLIL